jgi:hypothetical protein
LLSKFQRHGIYTYSINKGSPLKIFTVAKNEVAMRNKVISLGRRCGSLKTCIQGFTATPVFWDEEPVYQISKIL